MDIANKTWLEHLWFEQIGRSAMVFNLYGHALKSLERKLTVEEFLSEVKKNCYGPEIFSDGDPDGFLAVFCTNLLDVEWYNNAIKLLLWHKFGDHLNEFINPNKAPSPDLYLTGFWILAIYLAYSRLLPEDLGDVGCLLLSHNAQHVHDQAIMILFGLEIMARHNKRTSKMNAVKQASSKELADKIQKHLMTRTCDNNRFQHLSGVRKAEIIRTDLKKEEDIEVAVRTIRRYLASRT